ncbi:hypothetical protein [Shewanella violacea]|uniref:Lipoprotein n=1 Tax=Shewanella violacea (strain JCM 10179 / CIP 106290 / LMG 19151 / DSS12) TaxID=637905 RepID=D4ZJX6_SHEVD|nr:hypothetical protein [Shewanella violacea]BAJ01975.1 hypothetical protein SVI_2004 [Shewanella violacea DSS12]
MNKFNVNLGLKHVCLLAALTQVGCAELNDFPMDASYLKVKQIQILDPSAPERNEGIVGVLEGNYGERVMKAYRESNVLPKEARNNISVKITN